MHPKSVMHPMEPHPTGGVILSAAKDPSPAQITRAHFTFQLTLDFPAVVHFFPTKQIYEGGDSSRLAFAPFLLC
jgi:hypothetical protein